MIFSKISYQDNLISLIKQNLKDNSLANSMLFLGEKNTFKFHIALDLANHLTNDNKYLHSNNIFILNTRNEKDELNNHLDLCIKNIDNQKIKDIFLFRINKYLKKFSFINIDEKISEKIDDLSKIIYDIENNKIKKTLKHKFENILNDLEILYPKNINVNILRTLLIKTNKIRKNQNRIFIIQGIENLNEASSNLLLKTLEEPLNNIYFILTSRNKNKILKTILSRLRLYQFKSITNKQQEDIIYKMYNLNNKKFNNLFNNVDKLVNDFYISVIDSSYFKINFDFNKNYFKEFLISLQLKLFNEINNKNIDNMLKLTYINHINYLFKNKYLNHSTYNINMKNILKNIFLDLKNILKDYKT